MIVAVYNNTYFDVGSRQKMTDMDSKQAAVKCITNPRAAGLPALLSFLYYAYSFYSSIRCDEQFCLD